MATYSISLHHSVTWRQCVHCRCFGFIQEIPASKVTSLYDILSTSRTWEQCGIIKAQKVQNVHSCLLSLVAVNTHSIGSLKRKEQRQTRAENEMIEGVHRTSSEKLRPHKCRFKVNIRPCTNCLDSVSEPSTLYTLFQSIPALFREELCVGKCSFCREIPQLFPCLAFKWLVLSMPSPCCNRMPTF